MRKRLELLLSLLYICHPIDCFRTGVSLRKKLFDSVFKFSATNVLSVTDDDMIRLVENTSNGLTASSELKSTVKDWFYCKAQEYKDSRNFTVLQDPNLLGNFIVSYVDVGKSQREEGNPAGGGYRGRFGRLIFKNEGLYQHIIPTELSGEIGVINYVYGRLFGVFSLSVILRGVAKVLDKQQVEELRRKFGSNLSGTTVEAKFLPPLLGLGLRVGGTIGNITDKIISVIEIGPNSSVVLDTPYVSDKLRLGLGSRGSLFVFIRTNDPKSYRYKEILSKRPLSAKNIGRTSLLAGIVLVAINQTFQVLSKKALFPFAFRIFSMFLTLLGGVLYFSKGGIQ